MMQQKAVFTVIGNHRSAMVDAGGDFKQDFRVRLHYYGIRAPTSLTPVICADRVIRTLIEQIHVRKLALGDKHWDEYRPDVIEQSNATYRDTTHLQPDAAVYQNKAAKLRVRIPSKAQFKRTCPNLQFGVTIRVTRKAGKIHDCKADFNAWARAIYTAAETKLANGHICRNVSMGRQ